MGTFFDFSRCVDVHGLCQAFCILHLVLSQKSVLGCWLEWGEPEACTVPVSEAGSRRWVPESSNAEDNWYGQGKTEAFPD